MAEPKTGARQRSGLDPVVSLLEQDEAAQLDLRAEGDVARLQRMQFISFPIPDRGVPASNPDVLSLLSNISEALEAGKNVALHCRQGIGRSGMIAAALLVISGMSVDRAVEAVSAARGLTIPETPEQLHWLKRLPSRHLVPAS